MIDVHRYNGLQISPAPLLSSWEANLERRTCLHVRLQGS